MHVDLIFKVAGIGMIVAVMHIVLENAKKGEFAWLVTLSGILVVLFMLIELVTDLFRTVKAIFQL